MPEAMQDASLRRFGAFEINLQSGELRKSGKRLRLAGQPFHVLTALVERAGEIVTREELHSKLWPSDTFVDFDHGLNNAVARIREILNDSSDTPRYVETIPRRGYRFVAPVAPTQAAIASRPATELKISPPGEPTGSDTQDASVPMAERLLVEKRFATSRRTMLLVGAAVLAALVIGLVLYRGTMKNARKSAGQPAIKSLAVLPLKNLSGDPTQEYLADGMAEEIIGRLAGIHDLRVISRTSVMRFKNTKLLLPEIANMLRVDALVEGSVIRQGGKIRVQAQLIRGATDDHFWSETYDRDMADVLAVESDVARAISERVEVTLTGQEHSRLAMARHVSPEVYESYIKGQFGVRNTRVERERSITYFEDTIRKDPAFAPAYVGLAKTYVDLSTIFVGASPSEMRPKIISAARKALELDPDLADAHVLLADTYQKQWHWGEAEAEYRRALELKPNDATAQLGFSDWLMCQGRLEEALDWARRARELDPFGKAGNDIAEILYCARRYDESIRELRSFLAVHPDPAFAHWSLGRTLIGMGKPEQAIPELEKTVSMMNRSPGSVTMLAAAYGYAGHREEALRLISELKQCREKSYVPAGAFIIPYLSVRDYNEAFSWFERAYSEQSNILQFLKVAPLIDPVRGDPRFQDLVRRVGLN
ncbi:MAG TPA: tetratricopeptide repeat protein [Bryobacteraceae bacterium]|jgi:TolB-like protein/DNA-binding winged helix-turn-helix (wHTH) protein/tetratricopeptide (TPR) repeat protein